MRHLGLFDGIGGFQYAAQTVWGDEWEPVLFCENDPFCQKVLKKHWPDVPIHSDIMDLNCEEHRETVDLLTGGFPCQPYSVAGKQKGAGDDRALWPEMLRIIQEGKPTWIIGENVAGFINMGLDDCVSDLEAEGYEAQALVIPACAVDARHRRDRVWIVANTRGGGFSKSGMGSKQPRGAKAISSSKDWAPDQWTRGENVADSHGERCKYTLERQDSVRQSCGLHEQGKGAVGTIWPTEPDVGRVAHGIPRRVDRLKGLGNAIVPQVAMAIMEAIKQLEKV